MSTVTLLENIWFCLITYVVGGWCLLIQIFTKRKENHDIPLQTGKVAIVTGGASGIGFHISKKLVAKNVHVFIGGKSVQAGQEAIDEIRKDFPNAKVDFLKIDLGSIPSVREFATEFLARDLELHILINNAGVMFTDYEAMRAGSGSHEAVQTGSGSQIHVNFLSHFYLTILLQDRLIQSGRQNSWSRVVNVSSYMHLIGQPDLDTLTDCADSWLHYSPHKEYADSKLLVVAGANVLSRRFREQDAHVSVCSLHPGVVRSNLWHNVHGIMQWLMAPVSSLFFLSAEQGAETTIYAALSPEIEGQGQGCYYDNSKVSTSAALTRDKQFQEKLWTKSLKMIEKANS